MESLKWEDIAAGKFADAIRKSRGVCILPLGCLEKHGAHLPVGTDLFQIRAVAEAAVAIEPAVIFPPYYLTQVQCAKHQPGAVALPGRLITELLEGVCEEIARNGFRKIILLNGHGGNEAWLGYAAWMMAHERHRDFTVYLARLSDFYWANARRYAKLRQDDGDDHGGEAETSLMLAIRPDLVRMADADPAGRARRRLKRLPLCSPHRWYADYPEHYAGDGRYGSAGKGKAKLADCASNVAAIIRAVKRDTVAPRLREDFLRRSRHPAKRRQRHNTKTRRG